MRFIRRADQQTEAGAMPSEQLLTDMTKYNEELINAGVMLAGEGLQPSSKGARVRFRKGQPTVIDGPFAETKELIAGFSLIEAKSKEDAIEWVKRWPTSDGDGEVEIEIRQVAEMADFGATPELAQQVERLRERVQKRGA